MDAGGQKRILFQLSVVHKDTLTLVMDRKEEKDKDAIGRALAAGYRASRIPCIYLNPPLIYCPILFRLDPARPHACGQQSPDHLGKI